MACAVCMRCNSSVYYYITVMNENYPHPETPADAQRGILKGMYLFREGRTEVANSGLRVQLLGSATSSRESQRQAPEIEYGIVADIWSVTSFSSRREALDVTRWNKCCPPANRQNYHSGYVRLQGSRITCGSSY